MHPARPAPSRSTAPGRPAFTLVELLVVIGIVALLISILLPALGMARAQAQQLRCATILRAWGQGFYNYAAAYKGRLPHSGDRSCNPLYSRDADDKDYPQNLCGYTDLIPPLMNRKAWSSYDLGQRPTGDIWQCPLAVVLPDYVYGYKPSQTGYHSYVMNTYLDDDRLVMPAGFHRMPAFTNLAEAKQASATLLMFETTLMPGAAYDQDGYTGSGQTSCSAGQQSHDGPRALGERHPHQRNKLGGNLLMLDGHVEWTDHLYDKPLADPNTPPPQTDRRWWPY